MADSTWQLCDVANNSDFLPYSNIKPDEVIDIKANNVQMIKDGISTFTGNVDVMQNGQEIQAEHATYNQPSGEITLTGPVQIRDSEMMLEGENAVWSLNTERGSLEQASYKVREMHGRGDSTHVDREGKIRTELTEATYTTCDTGSEAWLLKASSVELDHEEAIGTARNVVLRLGNVPVFYTPYMTFPLNDERKSGFLVPSLGASNNTGVDIMTPYYWNISPDKDATITPRYMSDRGLMMIGEFRYLYPQGAGLIDAGYLNRDKLSDRNGVVNPYHDEDRSHFLIEHEGDLSRRWHTSVDYKYVSDNNYLEDFGRNLSLASTTHLKRKFDVSYAGDNWDFSGLAQGYQTLTNATSPYERLPQFELKASYPDQPLGMRYGLNAQYVSFGHSEKVTGRRFDIKPSVSLPWTSAAAFFKPKITLDYTSYALDHLERDSLFDEDNASPTRTLPIASVDSGLFFERDTMIGGSSYTHTLEPRAYYLYIPYRDQDDIPVFDSAFRTFSMSQLFSPYRFSGRDRIGDANRLSVAVTSRLIDQTSGRERLRLSFGAFEYFNDPRISTDEILADSDMIAEVVASIAKEWTVKGEIQWNAREMMSNMNGLELRYRSDRGALLNLGHRYRRDIAGLVEGVEQVDVSGKYPINRQWSLVGRWYHSVRDNKTLESLAGIEYESCCWATSFVVRDYVNNVLDEERTTAFFLQLELKGLGNIGNNTDALLQESILGYK